MTVGRLSGQGSRTAQDRLRRAIDDAVGTLAAAGIDYHHLPGLGGLHPLGAVVDRDRFELLMERKLLDQRLAQFGVVIDDQDLAGVGHRCLRNGSPRGAGVVDTGSRLESRTSLIASARSAAIPPPTFADPARSCAK